jgi:hypothetical protein
VENPNTRSDALPTPQDDLTPINNSQSTTVVESPPMAGEAGVDFAAAVEVIRPLWQSARKTRRTGIVDLLTAMAATRPLYWQAREYPAQFRTYVRSLGLPGKGRTGQGHVETLLIALLWHDPTIGYTNSNRDANCLAYKAERIDRDASDAAVAQRVRDIGYTKVAADYASTRPGKPRETLPSVIDLIDAKLQNHEPVSREVLDRPCDRDVVGVLVLRGHPGAPPLLYAVPDDDPVIRAAGVRL